MTNEQELLEIYLKDRYADDFHDLIFLDPELLYNFTRNNLEVEGMFDLFLNSVIYDPVFEYLIKDPGIINMLTFNQWQLLIRDLACSEFYDFIWVKEDLRPIIIEKVKEKYCFNDDLALFAFRKGFGDPEKIPFDPNFFPSKELLDFYPIEYFVKNYSILLNALTFNNHLPLVAKLAPFNHLFQDLNKKVSRFKIYPLVNIIFIPSCLKESRRPLWIESLREKLINCRLILLEIRNIILSCSVINTQFLRLVDAEIDYHFNEELLPYCTTPGLIADVFSIINQETNFKRSQLSCNAITEISF